MSILTQSNPSYNKLEIVRSGTTDIAVPDPFTPASSPLTFTLAHNLGFEPTFLAFGRIPSGSGVVGAGVLTNLPALVGGSSGISAFAQAGVDNTNFYIYVRNNAGVNLTGAPFGATWSFVYYILRDRSG